MNKKNLEEYLDYLGDAQPHHGLILFHLRTFADWLDKQAAAQQSVHPTVFTVATPESAVHEFCVAATIAMVAAGITKHVSFVHPEDLGAKPTFRMKAGGRIPKITIEWVHASEAEAEAER